MCREDYVLAVRKKLRREVRNLVPDTIWCRDLERLPSVCGDAPDAAVEIRRIVDRSIRPPVTGDDIRPGHNLNGRATSERQLM